MSCLLEISLARVYFARPTIAIAKIRDYSQSNPKGVAMPSSSPVHTWLVLSLNRNLCQKSFFFCALNREKRSLLATNPMSTAEVPLCKDEFVKSSWTSLTADVTFSKTSSITNLSNRLNTRSNVSYAKNGNIILASQSDIGWDNGPHH